ncbi:MULTISPECIES: hypothetical protein [Rhodococcus]|uniref:phage gene 29 protein family protein n=1 Tax=Rhodococcus TaxID=1827 RepID=UPI00143EF0CF|nr:MULTISPECIES: hypothetical protein [Rhodococcus]QIX48945.1 hypothetical protein HFP48_04825 [Rhodococcus sp. DMU1]QRI76004.1 hypothetical protein JQ505_26605 [Rhodococcus aetherivorans]QSE59415.1 hypothetical protein JYA75_27705 [Rhodococcus sp. PSBB066]QSE69260.1 hypothetical protein JYA91_27750 [Rhodococcus sp. PSBB049]
MTPEELQKALPPGMHPYAYVFMHPPTNGEGSPVATFEPDEINSLARHIERLGFRLVEEPLDRYNPPITGPIHPHNPGQWQSKKLPPPNRPDPYAHIRAQLAELPASARAELLEEDV